MAGHLLLVPWEGSSRSGYLSAQWQQAISWFLALPNNVGKRQTRMAKVKSMVSGWFRSRRHADTWCRISGCLNSMAAPGFSPLVAIQTSLAGNAAEMIELHCARSARKKG